MAAGVVQSLRKIPKNCFAVEYLSAALTSEFSEAHSLAYTSPRKFANSQLNMTQQ